MRLPNHRHWLRLIASVAAITAAATLSTAGCGQPHTPAIAPAATDPWPTVEAALDGTTEDRAAVELLSEATFHEAVAACMSRAGWSYQPDLADNGYQGWNEIPPATALPALRTAVTLFRPVDTVYIERHGLDVHKRLALQLPQTQLDNPAYLKLDPSKRAPYERQLQECQPDLEAFTGDRLVPQRARDLKNALLATMREIAARPDVAELLDYPACINAKGYIEVSPLTDRPVANWHDLAAVIRHDYEPYTDGVRLNRPDTDRGVAAVWEREHAAALADADCRRTAYHVAMQLLTEHLHEFAATHAEDFAALPSQWATLRQRADRLRQLARSQARQTNNHPAGMQDGGDGNAA